MSKDAPIRVCIVGAAGRMGQRLIALAPLDPGLRVVSGLETAAALAALGPDASGVRLSADPEAALQGVDLVIDFAAPAVAKAVAPLCATRRLSYVVGSTALSEGDERALSEASRVVPVLQAANFSVGVTLALELVEIAAARLGPDFAVEILELHHDKKRDAPSGTALALAQAVRAGGGELEVVAGRAGTRLRGKREVGVASLRGGDATGEHTVFFLGSGERLEVSHRATTPDILARGALKAASWLARQAPGRYGMRDVLGAKSPR